VLGRPSVPPGPKVSSFHAKTLSQPSVPRDARRGRLHQPVLGIDGRHRHVIGPLGRGVMRRSPRSISAAGEDRGPGRASQSGVRDCLSVPVQFGTARRCRAFARWRTPGPLRSPLTGVSIAGYVVWRTGSIRVSLATPTDGASERKATRCQPKPESGSDHRFWRCFDASLFDAGFATTHANGFDIPEVS
jgi:hypothetical protein